MSIEQSGAQKSKTYGNIFGTKATFHPQTPSVTNTLSIAGVRFISVQSFAKPSVLEKPSIEGSPPSHVHGYVCPEDSHFQLLCFFFRIGNYETSSKEETKVIQFDFSSSLYVLIPLP